MAKGGGYERDVCKQLTAWWTGDPARDVVFWRTAMSGGRATVRRKKNKDTSRSHCGDISATEPDAKPLTDLITFELKRGYGGHHTHVLLDHPPRAAVQTYEDWIMQAVTAAQNARTPYWALIHRRDKHEAVIAFHAGLYDALVKIRPRRFRPPISLMWLRVRRPGGSVMPVELAVVRLDEFLAAVTPAEIRTLSQRCNPCPPTP